ncbi:hypothetical protein IIE18_10235 [Pseudomonas sp. V1]|uniref:hypothetical protein n=1 Tax=Pseudomonas arcuscaelestis TaxID=2710591 RepID=UPI00193F6BAF|nr:hypothetical protein [Pseudomonas arcuscaelestis]MBM3105517.1 hypothetical protein [Pseudomonas arcuscaelestis]
MTTLQTAAPALEQWCLLYGAFPPGTPAMDAIVGPKFLPSKRTALSTFLGFTTQRLEGAGGLGEILDTLSDQGHIPKRLTAESGADLLAQAETMEMEVLEAICAGLLLDLQEQGHDVILIIEEVPTFGAGEPVELEQAEPQEQTGRRLLVTFHPQAWVNDNAISVDPGPTEIDVTEVVLSMDRDYALTMEDNSYESDGLMHALSAPDWVRNWTGPFYIECQEAIRAYFEGSQPAEASESPTQQ